MLWILALVLYVLVSFCVGGTKEGGHGDAIHGTLFLFLECFENSSVFVQGFLNVLVFVSNAINGFAHVKEYAYCVLYNHYSLFFIS